MGQNIEGGGGYGNITSLICLLLSYNRSIARFMEEILFTLARAVSL